MFLNASNLDLLCVEAMYTESKKIGPTPRELAENFRFNGFIRTDVPFGKEHSVAALKRETDSFIFRIPLHIEDADEQRNIEELLHTLDLQIVDATFVLNKSHFPYAYIQLQCDREFALMPAADEMYRVLLEITEKMSGKIPPEYLTEYGLRHILTLNSAHDNEVQEPSYPEKLTVVLALKEVHIAVSTSSQFSELYDVIKELAREASELALCTSVEEISHDRRDATEYKFIFEESEPASSKDEQEMRSWEEELLSYRDYLVFYRSRRKERIVNISF